MGKEAGTQRSGPYGEIAVDPVLLSQTGTQNGKPSVSLREHNRAICLHLEAGSRSIEVPTDSDVQEQT
jgi:hypothetical protein